MSLSVGEVLKRVFFPRDKRELGKFGHELIKPHQTDTLCCPGGQPALLTALPYHSAQDETATGAGVTEMEQTWSSIKPEVKQQLGVGVFPGASRSPSLLPCHQAATSAIPSSDPSAPEVGGQRGSLTLVAVRKEVSTGF